jgi:hypothetical protein
LLGLLLRLWIFEGVDHLWRMVVLLLLTRLSDPKSMIGKTCEIRGCFNQIDLVLEGLGTTSVTGLEVVDLYNSRRRRI